MKAKLILAALSTLMVVDAVAQTYRQCTWHTDRWGRRVQTCRTVTHRPAPNPVGDAIIVGAVAGATAGWLASTCAPEVVDGNLSATERALVDLSLSEDFADAHSFQGMVEDIVKTMDAQEKMGKYFSLVDLKDATEIVHFIGARDEELSSYAQILEQKADLSSEQAMLVVEKLTQTLRGGLR
jgi:hypothetical protein